MGVMVALVVLAVLLAARRIANDSPPGSSPRARLDGHGTTTPPTLATNDFG